MTTVRYIACDGCNPTHEPAKIGVWPGTVQSALRYGWTRVGGPSGGGSEPTKHYCPQCSYRALKQKQR